MLTSLRPPRKSNGVYIGPSLFYVAVAQIGRLVTGKWKPVDRLEAMSILLIAAECGSLSKASRRLRLPLTTVSRKVSDLESHLKADLLVRSSKGLELTQAGRSYVAAAKSILEQLDEAERAASGEYTEPKGDLVVTAPIMFGRLHLLPVVLMFLSAFPEVSVELMLTDRVTHFLDDQVDVALRIGDLPNSSLIATCLGTVRRVTPPISPADHTRTFHRT
jgi:DNA-binding transcriptional LysR family regulator